MKKLFSVLAIVVSAACLSTAGAQERVSVRSDTALNADTVYATYDVVPSKIVAFQVDLNKLSGTIPTTGIGLLQGTVNGTTWVDVNTDTLKLTNITVNSKVWPIARTTYTGYRICIRIPSGTQTSKATFTYLRRKDE
jgi:hypothetical protein